MTLRRFDLMKRLALKFLLPFIVMASGVAAEINTPDAFVSAFRMALQEKNAEALGALTYQVGSSDADKAQTARIYQMIVANPAKLVDVALKPLPEDFQKVVVMRGKKFEPTHPPSGMVEATYQSASGAPTSNASAYTIVDGTYYLVGTKSTDLGWTGPPDKTIGFMVTGTGVDHTRIAVTWNASGVVQEREFSEPSTSFIGQFIQAITVTSEQSDSNLTLTVLEDGQPIYTSEPLSGGGSLSYQRTAEAP